MGSSEKVKRRAKSRDYDTNLKQTGGQIIVAKNQPQIKHSNGRVFFMPKTVQTFDSIPPDKKVQNPTREPILLSIKKQPPDKLEKYGKNSPGENVKRKQSVDDQIEEFEQ